MGIFRYCERHSPSQTRNGLAPLKIWLLGLLLAIGWHVPPTSAVTTELDEFVCPIDGEKFSSIIFLSYSIAGQRLDTRPKILGRPGLLPLPMCPGNGFVLYKTNFSEAEIKRARTVVTATAFTKARSENTVAGMAAYLAAELGDAPLTVARFYLVASWEAEDKVNPAMKDHPTSMAGMDWARLVRDYRLKAIEYLQRGLPSLADGAQEKAHNLLLLAELSRLVGDFDQASRYLDEARIDPFYRKSSELEPIERTIRALVGKRQTDLQTDFKCPIADFLSSSSCLWLASRLCQWLGGYGPSFCWSG